ncbi:MAG: MarR family transcriptional regulator [Phycisphaerae bacterium]|nr:MarR family transcriptional regulator [Phycisphaerae bacterium]
MARSPADNKTAALQEMAAEIFELYRLVAIERSRRPSGNDELSEAEFLTLETLARDEPLTIGEVQKRIGVVPAQMSRIVRALEVETGKGHITCNINPHDRRRVDLHLTASGRKAMQSYRETHLGSIQRILDILSDEERENFMRVMRTLRSAYDHDSDTQS